MVPGALRVSSARPASSTSGASDLGGASVVRTAAAIAGGKGGHWRMRGRKWYTLLSGQADQELRVWSSWKDVGHAPFIPLSGTVSVAGGSR